MRARTTLMVASSGGHLTQLRSLAPRLRPVPEVVSWVSYDCTYARTVLADEDYLAAHGPTTRHLPNAIRNWVVARRLLSLDRVDRVISTGSGIAVPFLVEADRRGIPAHYIESASRVEGPSLTGRMLERMAPSARLYTQHAGWADDRWAYGGSVFEGYRTAPGRRLTGEGLRVLVTVGTHRRYPFPEMVEAVRTVLGPQDDVVWQLGVTEAPAGLPGVAHDLVPGREMERLLRWADVVVAHAGTGIILSCLEAGAHPVVVPRRAIRGEHVDDHQVITARATADLGLTRWIEVGALSRHDLRVAAALTCSRAPVEPFRLDEPAELPVGGPSLGRLIDLTDRQAAIP